MNYPGILRRYFATRNARSILKSAKLIPLALLLAGCAPWPHIETVAPRMSVIVQSGGHPVENAEVRLSSHGTDEIHTGRTDASGQVTLAALTKLNLLVSFLGDPLYDYELEITAGGQTYHGFTEGRIGHAPADIGTIFCDLAKPVGEGRQYCDDGRRLW